MKRILRIHIWASLAVGIVGLLTFLYPYFHRFHILPSSLLPFNLARISSLLSTSLGFLLFYLSLQLFRRKIFAYWISVIGLTILVGLSLLYRHSDERALFYLLALCLLILGRRTFSVKSDNLSVLRGVGMVAAILAVALLYGAIGFYLLEERDFNIEFTFLQSLKYTFLQIFTLQNSILPPETENAEFLLQSLDAISLLSAILITASLFRPVRFALGASANERTRAEKIITKYSRSTEEYFKLWPADKHYYFDTGDKAVLAYKVSAGVALVMDGPTGTAQANKKLLTDFIKFSADHGWITSILHGDDKLQQITKANGFKRVFIGSEAIVRVNDFVSTHQYDKHFRYVKNKAKRERLDFEYWQAPLSDEQIESLKNISDDWVGRDGRREYTFIMGYFSAEYLRDCDVAVLVQDGTYIAYANIIPSFVSDSRSIDHMRNRAEMPGIGMHYLLQSLIIRLYDQNVGWLNLGLSPLSGLEERLDPSLPEKFLKIIKSIGANYYSFKGLEQFKNKFKPDWQPRYVYYTGSPANLLNIVNSLSRAVTLKSTRDRRKVFLILAALVAALAYVSYPLAYLLNKEASRGIISGLGATGQPFAWLFNGLDILSGGIILLMSAYAYKSYSHFNIWRNRAIMLFAAGGVGALGAALAPLPSIDADTLNVYTLPHLLFSSLNFFGVLGAISIFVFKLAGKKRRSWTFVLYGGLLTAGLMAVILRGSLVGDLAQRIQISIIGLWIIILSLKLKSK